MLTGRTTALTEIRAGDSATLFAWINTPELVRLGAAFKPVHAASHDAWFDAIRNDPKRVAFAIRALPGDELIGLIQLVDVNLIHRSAEIVLRIGDPARRGKGHGTEAISLLLDHAWRDLGLHRVVIRAFATNAPALAAYRKAGFAVEGTLREAAFIDGRFVDVVIMSILAPSPA